MEKIILNEKTMEYLTFKAKENNCEIGNYLNKFIEPFYRNWKAKMTEEEENKIIEKIIEEVCE